MSKVLFRGVLPLVFVVAVVVITTGCSDDKTSDPLHPADAGLTDASVATDIDAPVTGDSDAPSIVLDPDAPVVPPDAVSATLPDAPDLPLPDAIVVAPVDATDWGTAQGLVPPIYDVSTDDSGNVWAIGVDTLYLLPPGASTFKAFGNADGLHVEPFTAPDGTPLITRLTAVGGATANRVYLGYLGYESDDPFSDTPEQKALGNGDRIDYDPASGTIAVNRYQFKCVVEVNRCWEDRSVRRIVVGHSGVAAGHAFFGFNHGTTHVFNDVLGDHVHPEINWVMGDQVTTKYGEDRALSLNDDGTLWIGTRYGVGLMNWNPDPIAWTTAKFKTAFTTYTDTHGLDVPWGYTENNEGAAVTGDGTLWLASSSEGLSSWNPATNLSTMRHWDASTGIPANLGDIAADTDGTLWIVVQGGGLLHLDPTTGAVTASTIANARHLYIDRTVTPRALYIARGSGLTVVR